jgi:hypothetical protein
MLLIAQALVCAGAIAGGFGLVPASIDPVWGSVVVTPGDDAAGSAFGSYIIPDVVLLTLVAGTHAIAFIALLVRSRSEIVLSATAGFACVIWIFAQVIHVPFGTVHALYFSVGLAELALTMVLLASGGARRAARRSTYVPTRSSRTPDGGL